MTDDGNDLGKLDYLRSHHGQRDRETLWRGGLGRIAGTGAGGLTLDGKPLQDANKYAEELTLDSGLE